MANAYDIEREAPSTYRCESCDGLTVRLTGFVSRLGSPCAVYFAKYSNGPKHDEIEILISMGDFAEDADLGQRAAFYCSVYPGQEGYEVSLGDASQSPWCDAETVGFKLSREEALKHPMKASVFEVLDEAFAQDRPLQGFIERWRCGDVAVPLERAFAMPDDIWALGETRKERATADRNFAALDGERFFVRSLLTIPVEAYAEWSVGLWVEVSKADYERTRFAWEDPIAYPLLQFRGKAANDLESDLELPLPSGSEVLVHVTNPDTPPRIASSTSSQLNELLSKPWPRESFERYAVSRFFL